MLKSILAAGLMLTVTTFPAYAAKNLEAVSVNQSADLLSVHSKNDFETTLAKLQAAVDKRSLNTFAVIDHAEGAASVGETLRPTTLVIFGNPKGGSPLMQVEQKFAIELPLKMLVAEGEDGVVKLYYADMAALFAEYKITDQDRRLTAIKGALDAIAAEAAAQ